MRWRESRLGTDATDKARPPRVCPLVCDGGFQADGDQCVKVAGRAGYRVRDECEELAEEKPLATRDDATKRETERRQSEAASSRPRATGQIYCSQSGGRRPVLRGRRTEHMK